MDNKTNLLDIFELRDEFQYSINLKYDLEHYEKIDNYILTQGGIKIINDIIDSLHEKATDRAKLLIGPYGKGKSHLVLVIISLLYHSDERIHKSLMNKIMKADFILYERISKIKKSKTRLLPVIVNSTTHRIDEAVMLALRETLVLNGFNDILPSTYFDKAIRTLRLWENEYIETYNKFSNLTMNGIDKLIEGLSCYQNDYYKEFLEIYPKVTSGSEFNATSNIDITKTLSDVSEQLKKRGFSGLFVIYDEFSKVLEQTVTNRENNNVKVLQDLAELSMTSKSNQIHLLLITHKKINSYTSLLAKESIDSWNAVSGRFKILEIDNTINQTYELMAQTILQKKSSKEYFEIWKVKIEEMLSDVRSSGVFNTINPKEIDKFLMKSLPLHPLTFYILPILSEKVAQNERTLFTFLSTYEKHSLGNFISDNVGFELLKPDRLYDYFEDQFRKESYSSLIYEVWRQTARALSRIDIENTFCRRIVKVIGLITMLDQYQVLEPNYYFLNLIFGDVSNEIQFLQKKKIIHFAKSSEYFKFMDATKLDVESLIISRVDRNRDHVNKLDILNEIVDDVYLYPQKYNDENEIVRYFKLVFMNSSVDFETIQWTKLIKSKNSDGLIVAIDSSNNIIEEASAKSNSSVVFVINNDNRNIGESIERYKAICELIDENSLNEKDELLEKELIMFMDDEYKIINDYIDTFIDPSIGKNQLLFNGKRHTISRKSQLNNLLSSVMSERYSKTPIIVNEMINKNNLTSNIVNSRNKIIDGLLRSNLQARLGLIGNGPDFSIARALLLVPGLIDDFDNPVVNLDGIQDLKFKSTIEVICKFIDSAKTGGKQSFDVLYNDLRSEESFRGLKLGPIPVLVSAVMNASEEEIIIYYRDNEIELTSSVFNQLEKAPHDYSLSIENWSSEKEDYLIGLENLFSNYLEKKEREYNRFDYIAKAMHRWYLFLPIYSKSYTKQYNSKGAFLSVEKNAIRFRKSLQGAVSNSREYIMDVLPKYFDLNIGDKELIKAIGQVKNETDNAVNEMVSSLANDILNVLRINESGMTLALYFEKWFTKLCDNTKNHIFGNRSDELIKVARNTHSNDMVFIHTLAKSLIGIRIEDWKVDNVDIFKSALENAKSTIDEFDESVQAIDINDKDDDLYKVSFTNESGEQQDVTFSHDYEISQNAHQLYSELIGVIEDYSYAIDSNEKLQVLMKVLKEAF